LLNGHTTLYHHTVAYPSSGIVQCGRRKWVLPTDEDTMALKAMWEGVEQILPSSATQPDLRQEGAMPMQLSLLNTQLGRRLFTLM